MPYLTYAPTLAAIEQTKLQAKQKKRAKLWIHGREIKMSVFGYTKAIHLQA
jgi:hypothetical protein